MSSHPGQTLWLWSWIRHKVSFWRRFWHNTQSSNTCCKRWVYGPRNMRKIRHFVFFKISAESINIIKEEAKNLINTRNSSRKTTGKVSKYNTKYAKRRFWYGKYETLELWREKTDNQKIQSRKTTRKPLKIKKSYGGASVEDIHLNQWVMAMIHPEVSEIPRLCQRYGVYKEAQPNLILVAFVLLSF